MIPAFILLLAFWDSCVMLLTYQRQQAPPDMMHRKLPFPVLLGHCSSLVASVKFSNCFVHVFGHIGPKAMLFCHTFEIFSGYQLTISGEWGIKLCLAKKLGQIFQSVVDWMLFLPEAHHGRCGTASLSVPFSELLTDIRSSCFVLSGTPLRWVFYPKQ